MKKFSFLFLLSLVFFSCSKDEETPTPDPVVTPESTPTAVEVSTVSGPMKVGSEINYTLNAGFEIIDVQAVVTEEVSEGVFVVKNYSDSYQLMPMIFYIFEGGKYYTSPRLRDRGLYSLECDFNASVGDTWSSVKSNGVTYEYQLLNKGITWKLDNGQEIEDVAEVKIEAFGQVAYNYYSESLGVVSSSYEQMGDDVQSMVDFKIGTIVSNAPASLPAISYGSFEFLKVGNYWYYDHTDLFGGDYPVKIDILSKNGENYYVRVESDGIASYSYWYEDRGYLMVYETTETREQADIIYQSTATAQVGDGWFSPTPSGGFIYKITKLNDSQSTYYGELPCTKIQVGSNGTVSQTNYWTEEKGNVLVTGLFQRDLYNSNVRTATKANLPSFYTY